MNVLQGLAFEGARYLAAWVVELRVVFCFNLMFRKNPFFAKY